MKYGTRLQGGLAIEGRPPRLFNSVTEHGSFNTCSGTRMKRTQSVSNSVIHPSSLQHSFVITNAVTTVAHAPITARVRLRRPFNKVQFFRPGGHAWVQPNLFEQVKLILWN